MKRTISETEYIEKHRGNKPNGVATWVFLFFMGGKLSGKFSCIGDYKTAKRGAMRFMKMGGHESGQVQ